MASSIETFNVRLMHPEKVALRELAYVNRCSMSDWIRQVIQREAMSVPGVKEKYEEAQRLDL